MCILFYYNNPNPSKKQYRLILVFNRDERYHRSTQSAFYLNDQPTIIGGRDLEAPEQGTWLGLSLRGRIAALLNVWCPEKITDSTRGTLAWDFLKDNATADNYVANIFSEHRNYNGYNLLLFEIRSKDITVTYATNKESGGNFQTKLAEGIHAFGNTVISTPLGKVTIGKEKFADIIEQYNSTDEKDKLLQQLLTFLKSRDKCPHEIPEELSSGRHSYRKDCNSIFVEMPDLNYGTRTHSIILVDTDDLVEFNEWTIRFDTEGNRKKEWLHTQLKEPLFY